jgi:hypothetical protein
MHHLLIKKPLAWKPWVRASVTTLLLGLGSLAHAQSSNFRFYGGVGFADGGETITAGDIVTQGTNKLTPYTIEAGGGSQWRAGLEYRLLDQVSLQASVGYVVSDPMGYNGSLTYTAVPFELLGFFNITESIRLGGGLRKTSANIRGTGVAQNWAVTGSYSGEPATVLELQYLFGPANTKQNRQHTQFGFSARAVQEKLEHSGQSINANHLELGIAIYF